MPAVPSPYAPSRFSTDQMLDDLRRLVEVESPSHDVDAIERSAAAVAELIRRRLGSRPELVASAAGPHVHWRGDGEPRVLVLGHHDTVFPIGTLATRPFTVGGGRVTGPGVFDMKGGLAVAVHAVAALDDRSGIELLISSDEEVGSEASRALIEARAEACGAVLVLEPSAAGGALKIGRKGVGTFAVTVGGRAAHAGLEPEHGINALIEAARQVLDITALAAPDAGTTVTPTVASAGTAENVVPAAARVLVDVRVTSTDEAARIETALGSLVPHDAGATVTVSGRVNRPPMAVTASTMLFDLAQKVATETGLAPLDGVSVGGGSDGNFTAALGVPTLDGLGVVGGGAHADHEWLDATSLSERASLVAGLVAAITARPVMD